MKPQVRMTQGVIARRVREVRRELFGENGGPLLADILRLPHRTWINYEAGVLIPGPVILRLIEATGVSPHWLLTGQGPRYITRSGGRGDRRGIA